MESLSEQHIDSLPEPKREEAYQQVGIVCAYRMRGDLEADVARMAKFASVEDMYFRLKRWGLYGLLPSGAEKPQTAATPKRKARRSRRGEGEAIELPPTADAAELIRGAIKKLERDTDNLWRRMEYRKDKRFVVYWTMLSSTIYERDRGWANLWEEICAAVGEDPATTERVEVPDSFKIAMGASPTPPAPLPELIAVYVLAGEPLEPLLEKLCLWPEDMDNAKLLEVVNKLKLYAAQLARLVRGGEVKQGPPAEGLSGTQLWAARHIQKWREQGMTDGDILELLHEHGREFGSDLANLTREDVSRLGDLRPPAPHAIYVSHSCLI